MKLEQLVSEPEENLAIGVLRQALHDLRRFKRATGSVERELYLDAYRWITASDESWPYSFENICKLLDVPVEIIRGELLADAGLSPLRYWRKATARFARCCRASLSRTFAGGPSGYARSLEPQLTQS